MAHRRDARVDPALGKSVAKAVAVIAFVADQHLGLWQVGQQYACALVVAHLPFAKQQDNRPAQSIADGVELQVQPTFGAPDTSGNSPPFKRLAAVQ